MLSDRKLQLLTALAVLLAFAGSVVAAEVLGRRRDNALESATFADDRVVLAIGDGSMAWYVVGVVVVLALAAGLARLLAAIVTASLGPTANGAWRAVPAVVVGASVVGLVLGELVFADRDEVEPGAVVGWLEEGGSTVDAELVTGRGTSSRFGGRRLELPAVVGFELEGRDCQVTVTGPTRIVDRRIELTALCSGPRVIDVTGD